MHRPRSQSAIYRFRIVALLWFVGFLLFPIGGGLFVYSFIETDNILTWIAIILIILAGIMLIAQLLISSRTYCPLCMVPVMANLSCAKNRHARKLFGSYRTYVAGEILFRNSFRCPYCNEPTALQVRSKPRNPTHPGG